jgi:hypothetical protein
VHFTARDGFMRRRAAAWLALAASSSAFVVRVDRSLATSGRRAIDSRPASRRIARGGPPRRAQRMTEQMLESPPNPIFFKGTMAVISA